MFISRSTHSICCYEVQCVLNPLTIDCIIPFFFQNKNRSLLLLLLLPCFWSSFTSTEIFYRFNHLVMNSPIILVTSYWGHKHISFLVKSQDQPSCLHSEDRVVILMTRLVDDGCLIAWSCCILVIIKRSSYESGDTINDIFLETLFDSHRELLLTAAITSLFHNFLNSSFKVQGEIFNWN